MLGGRKGAYGEERGVRGKGDGIGRGEGEGVQSAALPKYIF